MKLNDDQCKVMHALLDGKTVKVNLGTRWQELQQLTWLDCIGDGETQYRIEEPAIKVALFERYSRICCFTAEEIDGGQIDKSWIQISDWVEITPTKELK